MEDNFKDYVDSTNLDGEAKLFLKSIPEYLEGKHPTIFANRSFVLEGEPGVGKTFLTKKLVKSLNCDVLFMGQSNFSGKNIKKIKKIKQLFSELDKFEKGVVYLDDLKYLFAFRNFGELNNEGRKDLMKLLEYFKENDKRTILITTLNDSEFFDDSFKDRVDALINFNAPSNENKARFIKDNFSEYLGKEEIKYLAENTIGYNYRDLPNLLKISYYKDSGRITIPSIKKALEIYIPSSVF
jgi:AAA+ superfamily predicted ATPase